MLPRAEFRPVARALRNASLHIPECPCRSSPPCDATNRSAHSYASQCRHNRASRNERSDSRNRQRSDSHQPSQHSSYHGPAACSSRNAFRCFCPFLVREIFRSDILRKQHRDIRVSKAQRAQRVHRAFYRGVIRVNAKNCRLPAIVSPPHARLNFINA